VEAADCIFLAAISFASSLWYLFRLGFYSDDWGLFAAFALSPDRSMRGLVNASFLDRPAQGVYSIILFRLFGLNPLGYHVVNAIVLACVSMLLYLVLRRLQPSRAVAFAAALAYTTFPGYSTDRFWFAAFAALLSIVFYLISLLADLEAALLSGMRMVVVRLCGVAALLVSVLLYETAFPLFFLNPLLVWFVRRRGRQPAMTASLFWSVFAGINWVLLLAVAIYKASTSPRLHAPRGFPALMTSIVLNLFRSGFKPGDYGLNLRAAFDASFGAYLLRLPATIWALHLRDASGWLPAVSILFGIVVYRYARSIQIDTTPRRAILLTAAGFAAFGLGYAMFLTNKAIQITPTGVGNRTSIAAALGVAISVAGAICFAGARLRHRALASAVFASLLAAFAGGGFFVISSLSDFWVTAYARERSVESDIVEHVGKLPSGTTLMLAGICSYEGPAIIYEADWDLAGALRLHYGDRTLSADVLRPGYYTFTPTGIATILYEGEDDYDFDSKLLLYDYRSKTSYPLKDKETAFPLLSHSRLDANCPGGSEGVGTPVF